MQAVQVIRGLLCVAGGSEDGAIVVLQHLKPVRDVARVVLAWFKRKIQVRAEERRTEFRDKLLDGVGFRTKSL